MLRSIWFWLLVLVAAVAVFWFTRDQITPYIPETSFNVSSRTTDTQKLAKTVSPGSSANVRSSTFNSSRIVSTLPATRDSKTTPVNATARATLAVRALTTSQVATPGANTASYTVRAGDTLYSIAKKYGMDVNELMRLNGISDPTSLQINQTLKVATAVSASAAAKILVTKPVPAGARTYTVKAGDTLSSIARSHGASLSELLRLNTLADPNDLTVGMALVVPNSSATATRSGTATQNTPAVTQTVRAQPSPTPNPATPTPGRLQTNGTINSQVEPQVPISASVGLNNVASPAPLTLSTPRPLSTATFTPVPLSVCPGGESIALVWGVSFCLPEGWDMYEQGPPNRGVFALATESNGDRTVFGVIRPEGWPNAPLSWAMRTAKGSIQEQAQVLIPSGITEPQNWTATRATSMAGVPGQMVEASTTYKATNSPARLRLIVFNHEGQRWWVMMLAPQNRWKYYVEAGFPSIADTLSVF